MKLIVLGINLGQFYSVYTLKQFLSIQTDYKVANFWTDAYFQNKLPGVPYYNLKNYIEADWSTGREIIKQLPFSEIILYFAPVTKGLSGRAIDLYRQGTFKNSTKGMSFSSVFKEYKKLLLCIDSCIDSGLPCRHVINDDLEPDLSQFGIKEECFYEIPGRATKSDYLEKMIELQPGPLPKTIPFTFGFSNVSKISFRANLYKELKDLNIPFTYKGPEEDSLLPVEEYNHLLRLSKYTYLIPSYCPDACSLIRILEAQHRGVKVLAHPSCNFTRINTPVHKHVLDQIEIVEPKHLKERIYDH